MGELFMSMLKSGLSYRLDAEIRYLEDFFAAKKRVFLYGGTGEAKKILEILALAELKPSGIIVSDGCRKDNVLYGLKVVETSEISLDETADGIIMAVKSMRNSLDVLATIREHWGGIQVYWRGAKTILPNARNYLPVAVGARESGPYFRNFYKLDDLGHKYGTDKASGQGDYLRKYEMFLGCWKNKTFNMLELGVFKGASLRMWGEFFPNARVYGADINPECKQYASDNREVFIVDLGSEEELIKLRQLRPEIIVDDASHLWSHQVKALLLLWEALPHGGIYILEDIGTAFSNLAGRGFDDAILSGYDFCSAVAECVTSGEHLRMMDRTAGQAIFTKEIERIAVEVDMITFVNGSCLMVKA